jgi:hypothetical protein
MSHTSSRRRAYGKRQRDLRDRRALGELVVDQDGPLHWPRGRAWDGDPGSRHGADVTGGRRDEAA